MVGYVKWNGPVFPHVQFPKNGELPLFGMCARARHRHEQVCFRGVEKTVNAVTELFGDAIYFCKLFNIFVYCLISRSFGSLFYSMKKFIIWWWLDKVIYWHRNVRWCSSKMLSTQTKETRRSKVPGWKSSRPLWVRLPSPLSGVVWVHGHCWCRTWVKVRKQWRSSRCFIRGYMHPPASVIGSCVLSDILVARPPNVSRFESFC